MIAERYTHLIVNHVTPPKGGFIFNEETPHKKRLQGRNKEMGIMETINYEIKQGEAWLKEKGVTFQDIQENKHELEGQISDDANWEAGRLDVLYKLRNGN